MSSCPRVAPNAVLCFATAPLHRARTFLFGRGSTAPDDAGISGISRLELAVILFCDTLGAPISFGAPGTFGTTNTLSATSTFGAGTTSTFGTKYLRCPSSGCYLHKTRTVNPNLAWLGEADDAPPWLRRRKQLAELLRSGTYSYCGSEPRVVRLARCTAQALLRSSAHSHRGSEGNTGTTFGAVPLAVLHLCPALAYP